MGRWPLFMCLWAWEGGAVPQQRGIPLGPKFQGLSLFGQWLVHLCEVLRTTQAEVARKAGINASTLSFNTRDVSPRPETVQKLWQVLHEIGDQKGIHLSHYVEIGFFNGAGFASPGQQDISRAVLETFKNDHGIGYEHEIEVLQKQLAEKEEKIRQFEEEQRKREDSLRFSVYGPFQEEKSSRSVPPDQEP